MLAVLQRVNKATVFADGILSGSIGRGLYILLGVEKGDDVIDAELLCEKISKLRIFSDENGKMNLSVKDVFGEALVVSNFTLLANYSHGNRPDYFNAAEPEVANSLYQNFVSCLKGKIEHVETGNFGSDMRSELETDGPVTIVMNSKLLRRPKYDT